MSAFPSAEDMWTFFISPKLPAPLSYIPLVFRVLALLLATPFAVGVALDLIAYAIARTLHISASSLRVPRSPPHVPRELSDEVEADDDDWGVPSAFTSGLESRQLSPKKTTSTLPATTSSGASLSRTLLLCALGIPLLAAVLQWLSMASNTAALNTLRARSVAGLGQNHNGAPLETETETPTALVLTAHPDDEVMFFAPTILNLVSSGWDMLAICVSDGNADRLGSVRSQELYESYMRLGVSSDNVTVVDNPDLQDGMDAKWDPQLIANIIGPYIAHHGVTHLITFDSAGITKHPNHIALSEVYPLLPSPRPRLLSLRSPSVATKFTGPLWSLVLAFRDGVLRSGAATRSSRSGTITSASPSSASASPSGLDLEAETEAAAPVEVVLLASPAQYVAAIRAMMAHASQLVWFRWLYISFSHLMWVNQLIDCTQV